MKKENRAILDLANLKYSFCSKDKGVYDFMKLNKNFSLHMFLRCLKQIPLKGLNRSNVNDYLSKGSSNTG